MFTTEVAGPNGRFVIRADRHGVPTESFLRSGLEYLVRRLLRAVRRDQTWVVRVRARSDDPWGPDVYSLTVASKAQVAAAITTISERIRSGQIPEL